MTKLFSIAFAATLLTACTTAPRPTTAPPSTQAAPAVNTVAERYVSAETPQDELDSLATWPTEDGRTWLIASAKSTHRLVVFDADSGERLREVGKEGASPGEFDRPNGLAVYGDQLFVVERDNHRVQVLSLPDFKPVGSFGEKELRSPYGIWLTETEPGELEAYITDSFMYGKKFDEVPPFAELNQRVRRYRVQFDQAGRLRANYGGSFGDVNEDTALRMVESIGGDPVNDRLLIADEDRRHLSTLREYTFSGKYTGRSLPQDSFGAEAEGVALWTCPGGGGYWIAVDQLAPLTIFHLFDRVTLQPRGSFEGKVTAHTDGVALHAAATPSFPGGALFAVHDDKSVTAFDLRDVAKTLSLEQDCTQ
ncbi:3-phytase [Lysobacter niastensis]|uniref:3-phytase n=1 Tax=Lysobacter niastensis TaxID=380629 RepID=A0ABU1W825_9GAMM|nr:phytase [Lysobacter niastensis]MDR7133731.1 3-phytase [Lysobacter niastensis]